jgi:hypothetical protein
MRNRSAKQKDIHISGYVSCKSFNIEYWKDYSANNTTNNNNNQLKKTIVNEKIRGRRFFRDDILIHLISI